MHRTRARAISLIEVVASLVLVATTVTALLAAHGRSLEQLRATRQQQTAATLARELITEWQIDPLRHGAATQGEFESVQGWRWTRRIVPYPFARGLPLHEVTLRIYRIDANGQERALMTYTWIEGPNEE